MGDGRAARLTYLRQKGVNNDSDRPRRPDTDTNPADWALLAKQGYAAQNDDLGVPLDASKRQQLETQKLISSVKREHNTLWLKLEDAGQAWAEGHLTKALPPNQIVLNYMMVRIDAHLAAKDKTLVGLNGVPPKVDPMDPELTEVVKA